MLQHVASRCKKKHDASCYNTLHHDAKNMMPHAATSYIMMQKKHDASRCNKLPHDEKILQNIASRMVVHPAGNVKKRPSKRSALISYRHKKN